MGCKTAPIAFEWMTPIFGWINQHDQHDHLSGWTISKSMPDFSQTFLQNLNCEKLQKSLQPHLKSPLANVRDCGFQLTLKQTNIRITSSISNSQKRALPRSGITVPVDVLQAFIFKIWPTLTKVSPQKKIPPKHLFLSLENCGSIFEWSFPPVFELFPATSNSFNPPTFQRPVWSFLHWNPRY